MKWHFYVRQRLSLCTMQAAETLWSRKHTSLLCRPFVGFMVSTHLANAQTKCQNCKDINLPFSIWWSFTVTLWHSLHAWLKCLLWRWLWCQPDLCFCVRLAQWISFKCTLCVWYYSCGVSSTYAMRSMACVWKVSSTWRPHDFAKFTLYRKPLRKHTSMCACGQVACLSDRVRQEYLNLEDKQKRNLTISPAAIGLGIIHIHLPALSGLVCACICVCLRAPDCSVVISSVYPPSSRRASSVHTDGTGRIVELMDKKGFPFAFKLCRNMNEMDERCALIVDARCLNDNTPALTAHISRTQCTHTHTYKYPAAEISYKLRFRHSARLKSLSDGQLVLLQCTPSHHSPARNARKFGTGSGTMA